MAVLKGLKSYNGPGPLALALDLARDLDLAHDLSAASE
jgi:hypothetical protein